MNGVDPLDLVVVGGGIHGTGIARDAARRGLRVALYERADLGNGTSSASSKLAHGGLRYLEQFQFGLVHEALHERHRLLRTAPHLVRPLPFLAPVSEGSRWSRWQLGPGLWLYDLLAGRRSIERHRWLDRARALEAEPALDAPSLRGAYRYVDAQMDDARLCVENAIDAAENGARIHTRSEVTGLIVHGGTVAGVRVRGSTGDVTSVRARLVVNAAGPWYDRIASAQDLARPARLRLSRGTHVVVPPLTRGHALILTAREDGRVFFVLPFKGRSLIGTTEAEHLDPDTVEPTEEEIDYLLRATSGHLQGPPLQRDQVLHRFAGVRALRASDEDDTGRVPRSAEIREDAPGLIGVLGGKYTTYRAVAERVVDAAERRLRGRTTRCTTATTPLPGGAVPAMNDYFRVAEDLLTDKYDGLDVGLLRYLVGTYGARHTRILRLLEDDPAGVERIEPGLPFTMAEVEHCVRQEFARSVDDVVHRRCYRGVLGNWTPGARDRWQHALERALSRAG
ncbi:MAG TPA: glycerol-3-phosphate dehydrogenase [Candidatus Krumholzibacteria bacterium]|nr:glycerol-3-phosphate dehydrogenase [Candidatus Krumholzibacteria bacterium]